MSTLYISKCHSCVFGVIVLISGSRQTFVILPNVDHKYSLIYATGNHIYVSDMVTYSIRVAFV